MAVHVAVVGGGPAGLAAAEVLAGAGLRVTVIERMPSPARKLLIAGRGGLNLTHSEPLERFLARYAPAERRLDAAIRDFPPQALRDWCKAKGIERVSLQRTVTFAFWIFLGHFIAALTRSELFHYLSGGR